MTQLGGLPMNAGKGVFHGVAGVFKRGDKEEDEVLAVPSDLPAGQSSQPVGVSDHIQTATAAFPVSENGPAPAVHEPGSLRVTVLDAKDLAVHDAKSYTTLRLGDKEVKTKHTGKTDVPEWWAINNFSVLHNTQVMYRNESFIFAASALTPKMYVWIHDHRTIGKDKEIADGEIDVCYSFPHSCIVH